MFNTPPLLLSSPLSSEGFVWGTDQNTPSCTAYTLQHDIISPLETAGAACVGGSHS